jgi:predicted acyl esterase
MRSRVRRTSWRHAVAGMAAVVVGLAPTLVATAPTAGATSSPGLRGNGSIDEAWLTGAHPGDAVTLLHNGSPVTSPANPGTADALGSLILRDLTPGSGYAWDDTTSAVTTPSFTVLALDANPATGSALYNGQPLHSGLNYLTMRDGVQLAATVRYPFNVTCSTVAPCPTVIEYSGYGTAGPSDPIASLLGQSVDTHLLPDGATQVGSVVARAAGFATVSLQMRGTGCSGGAYDLFGYPSDYDAYDAIEIVAHQNWVSNHKVGMVGISYSGLSEFPSAGTNPPDLAAIAPMSPTDDLFSTGYPGGIYNNGFAAGWIGARIDDARAAAAHGSGGLVPLATTPVSHVGQSWVYYEIDAEMTASSGTSSNCLANQALHGQSESLASLVGPAMVAPGTGPGRDPSLFVRRSMSQWASRITSPVFVSGAVQDEQTGPQWTALLSSLPPTTPVFAHLINGGHIDSTGPQIISQWLEFLDIYVAGRVPTAPTGFAAAVLGNFTKVAASTSGELALPATRFTTDKNVTKARADFARHTPRVTVLFDNGASTAGPGNPGATFSAGFNSWPAKGRTVTYYLGTGGALATRPMKTSGSASLLLDPTVRPAVSLPSGNPWAAAPPWNWTTVPAADGLGFQTTPFTTDTTIVGPATLDLWIRASTPILDFQASITEVRPSANQEEYVTSGFLRSSNQVDLVGSSPIFTIPSYQAADAQLLSPTAYRLVKIPIAPIAHTFRAGTELRVVVSAPGGDRPSWTFDTIDAGQTATVGLGTVGASALVVRSVRGVTATPTVPTCASLRGEPCRAYQAEGNQA